MAYATGTGVSIDKTEAEIKSSLRRYGATSFASYESGQKAMIAFEMDGRRIVFSLPLPDVTARAFTHRKANATTMVPRSPADVTKAWDQACRERWRALSLCIKAKLESVESGIESFEDAFLAHIQMPDGRSVGDHAKPAIAHAYQTNTMTPLLPGPRS